MHTHVSAVTAATVFLMVLILGTFWRLGSAALAKSDGPLSNVGAAMALQF